MSQSREGLPNYHNLLRSNLNAVELQPLFRLLSLFWIIAAAIEQRAREHAPVNQRTIEWHTIDETCRGDSGGSTFPQLVGTERALSIERRLFRASDQAAQVIVLARDAVSAGLANLGGRLHLEVPPCRVGLNRSDTRLVIDRRWIVMIGSAEALVINAAESSSDA